MHEGSLYLSDAGDNVLDGGVVLALEKQLGNVLVQVLLLSARTKAGLFTSFYIRENLDSL